METAAIKIAGDGQAVRRITPPDGFPFPFSTYPLAITRRGGRFATDFDPESRAGAALAGPAYYVDIATGNDANAGTSAGAPLRSIHKATQLGNAGGVPFQVRVKSGTYPRANNFTNNGTMVIPTQPVAYLAEGGRVTSWSGNDLVWPATPDPTYPNCYVAARGNVTFVLDLLANTADGDRDELRKVADPAACHATAGSWVVVGSSLYVHRADGLAPTNANTRVLLVVDSFALDGTAKSVYLRGFDFEGGSNGGVFVHDAATRDLIFVDCSAKYAGGPSNPFDGFRILDTTGLVAFIRCTAAAAAKDGFNLHWSLGGTPALFHLSVDCIGRNNGRYSGASNNGLTGHDGLVGIDIGGLYFGNFGPNVVSIGASRLWCVGTRARDSHSDVSLGGIGPSCDFNTQDTTIFWLESTASSGSTLTLVADGQSTIRTRHHASGPGQGYQVGVSASILSF
ncbi:hypothetical protein OSH11_00065 [Kaistia dalseonensis]|uniref:Uncharacterized protein n=1 Tax=Kaistia dalseonensis TaxID=410840 RepID=A0ABU0H2D7_9HYPH|nr:hypothetical protein [Kaistia dalseonensis]MCX5493089.1 hypothetical protein [Kaistia dalseonensis]MDQ0435644.1 hypothetical protein [Kaistia dalseonensis]